MRILTAGVYGHTEESFFAAIERAKINVFVDARRRRAVRGSQYAFANSQRLQDALASRGIRYHHALELAPSKELIASLAEDDHARHIRRSDRDHLTDSFREAFEREVLSSFDTQEFVNALAPDANSILIFCVERTPAACHRSLVADRLARDLGAEREDILPPNECPLVTQA